MSTEQRKIDKFVEVARDYCNWAEESNLKQYEDVKRAVSLLVRIYAAVLELPNEDCDDELDLDEERISEEEWKRVIERFRKLPFNYYLTPFSPAELEKEVVTGDLADDLADIYRDLKSGILLYEKGKTNEALWEWTFSFNAHWGRHAVSALHALHCYIVDYDEEF